jgi:hypothetical protein
MLIPALAGCNQMTDDELPTETPTSEPENDKTEEVFDTEDHFVSFVAYNKETAMAKKLSQNGSLACRFTVPEGYLSQINASMAQAGDVQFTLYKWNKNYATTIAGEPIKQVTYLKENLSMYGTNSINLEIKLEENEAPAGHYLYVISMVKDSENHPLILTGKPWSVNKLPSEYAEEYSKYNLYYISDGEKTTAEVAQSSFVFSKKVPHTDVAEEKIPEAKDPEGTAKVILIGGQSNAEGATLVSCLQNNVSPEKFEEYTRGYSNVKIMYENASGLNVSDGFVDAKAGQGVAPQYYGPELGLAEFLAKNFPDEKFYIIKYTKGGSVLDTEWYNAKTGTVHELLQALTNLVWEGLEAIEAEGLTPKIVGFVWNQGESDAIYLPRSARYYANLEGLVNYVRTTFSNYASAKGIGFIDAGIADTIWNAYMSINMQKQAFAATSPINFYIDISKYPEINAFYENNDIAHYDSLGMIKLGQLYGEQISKLLG